MNTKRTGHSDDMDTVVTVPSSSHEVQVHKIVQERAKVSCPKRLKISLDDRQGIEIKGKEGDAILIEANTTAWVNASHKYRDEKRSEDRRARLVAVIKRVEKLELKSNEVPSTDARIGQHHRRVQPIADKVVIGLEGIGAWSADVRD